MIFFMCQNKGKLLSKSNSKKRLAADFLEQESSMEDEIGETKPFLKGPKDVNLNFGAIERANWDSERK